MQTNKFITNITIANSHQTLWLTFNNYKYIRTYIMKKILIVSTVFGLLAMTGTASAHGSHLYNYHSHYTNNVTKTSGPYIGVSSGKLKLDLDAPFNDFDDTTHKIFVGYQINNRVAIEAHHTQMDGSTNIAGFNTDIDVKAAGVSAVFTPFNTKRIIPFGKIGVTKVRAKAEIPASGLSRTVSATGASAGLGVIVPINKKFKLRAEYEKFDSDVDMLSIGASFHF